MLLSLLISGALATDCDRGWSRKAVLSSVSEAEQAHAELDVEGLHSAADEVRARLVCVGEPFTPVDAARLHRVEALSRFAGGDRDGAAMAFAASRALEPDWAFPANQVAETHPLRGVYKELPVHSAAYAGVPSPATGSVLIDGAERRGRPKDWPALVQILDDEGGVLTSAYLWPDDAFPEVSTEAAPLPLYGAESFRPPTRDPRPDGLTPELEHERAGVRYDAVSQLQGVEGASALILWVLFTDPDEGVRFKAWRILRSRAKRGFGDMALQGEAVRWLAEQGEGEMMIEAAEVLPRLPAD
jgi:hypothetical protein